VVVPWSPDVAFHRVTGLAGGRADTLRSHYRATPAMVANLVHAYGPVEGRQRFRRSLAHHLLDGSLADLRATLAAREADLAELPPPAGFDRDPGAVGARTATRSRIDEAVAGVRPGDVIVDPGRASVGRLLVVAPPRVRRGQATLDTVRGDAQRVVVPASDFRLPPVVVGFVDLSDLAATGRGFARVAADRLRSLPDEPHPTAPPPERDHEGPSHAAEHDRLAGEVAALRERLAADAAAHDHEFDAVADLLRRRGHLEGWRLTDSGRMVRRLFHERGLLVAECLAAGIFDDLDPPALAAAVSAFRSGSRQELAPSPFPTSELRERWRRIEAITSDLERTEADAGLPLTPPPDAALLGPIHRWAAGCDLGDALRGTALGPGDLAREVRQVLELLEQVTAVAPAPIAAAADAAIVAMSRGVVVATAHGAEAVR
jgi:ATP-dependent RNA helicase HelY